MFMSDNALIKSYLQIFRNACGIPKILEAISQTKYSAFTTGGVGGVGGKGKLRCLLGERGEEEEAPTCDGGRLLKGSGCSTFAWKRASVWIRFLWFLVELHLVWVAGRPRLLFA